ncbi:hypothetical protein M2148_002675, partial [Lachnospiraceae bacterium PF1-4]
GHPCLRLYPSHYRADCGLTPVRNVRRQAHCKTGSPIKDCLFFFTTNPFIVRLNRFGWHLPVRGLPRLHRSWYLHRS